ncbi:tetratricopeptide repeat protein [Spirulina sp. 06S082]|uniref:tetratricopeptide repeat protein n=1 Tax=Spirulina sp. 06S082 TaxID=3110248 RepID=UPI002B207423|nr:tetratricopeptide repeat protein [Spirulina sp. 06S082]MEA5470745.1 tetratricopeptide repeat protein [Spirulina sp. 06S082]
MFLLPAFAQESEESDRLDEILEQCRELEREEKLAACDRAIELDETNYIAWFQRGIALSILGRYEEADTTYDKAKELLEMWRQEELGALTRSYNTAFYNLSANFARQDVVLSLYQQCYNQISSQFQEIQSLLQDEQRVQQLDEAIASGTLSGERLKQLQTIREQIRTLQRNPENLNRQRVQALATCKERADELMQNIDDDLRNKLESLEENSSEEL